MLFGEIAHSLLMQFGFYLAIERIRSHHEINKEHYKGIYFRRYNCILKCNRLAGLNYNMFISVFSYSVKCCMIRFSFNMNRQ